MQLTRDIAAVIVGALLSFLMMGMMGWLLARTSDSQFLIKAYQQSETSIKPSQDTVEHTFAAIERIGTRIEWFGIPIIVFLSSMAAAFIGSRVRLLLGVLGVAPFSILMTASGPKIQYPMLLFYLAVSVIGAAIPVLIKFNKTSNQGVQGTPAGAGAPDALR